MDDSDDGIRNLALGVVAAVVALVITVVLAVAIGTRPDAEAASADRLAAAGTIRFDRGGHALSAQAAEQLARVAEVLRLQEAEVVIVTPVFGESADAPLALRRALAVRHALEANGVPAGAVVVNAPQRRPGEGVEVLMR